MSVFKADFLKGELFLGELWKVALVLVGGGLIYKVIDDGYSFDAEIAGNKFSLRPPKNSNDDDDSNKSFLPRSANRTTA